MILNKEFCNIVLCVCLIVFTKKNFKYIILSRKLSKKMSLIGKIHDDNIPLADDDPQVIINDESDQQNIPNGRSMDSLQSSYSSPDDQSMENLRELQNTLDEKEEKARLISQVLELQNTLDDLDVRVNCVKGENLKLKSENQVLGQYIENLMSASSVFQSTSPSTKKK